MPTYLQHNPDGTKTTVKYSKSTPRHVTRRMKLLGYIASVKKRIRNCRQNRRYIQQLPKHQAKLAMFESLLKAHYSKFPQSRPIGYEQPSPGIGRAGNGHPASPPDHRAERHNQQVGSASVAQAGSRQVNARDFGHKRTPDKPAAMSGPGHPDRHSRSTVQWDASGAEELNPTRQVI